MNFVIGDVHGEISKLKRLINYIISLDQNCSLIFIGDYIDKGENSKHVLDYLMEVKEKYNCIFLLGNHEYYWLNNTDKNLNYIKQYGGNKTIESFNFKSINKIRSIILKNYKSLIDSFVNYYLIKNYIITHSGLDINNFNEDLNNIPTKNFLFNRYEFIKSKNKFKDKYKFIFGHTGFYTPYVDQFKIGIDTGACFLNSQPLTSFCIEEEFFLNSSGVEKKLIDSPNNSCPNIIRIKV